MKYGFIGCGNMGGAIARAVTKATKDILVADPSPKAKALAEELGIASGGNSSVAGGCERIFLGVKPYAVASVLEPLRDTILEHRPLIISMAAGVPIQRLEGLLGGEIPIIRIMPNTPTAVGKGVIPFCRNARTGDALLKEWLEDMRFCGLLDEVDEKWIDATSALSGSGPAYAAVFAEALADGAVACGLPRDKAIQYAARTLEGTAALLLQTGQHPGALKDSVSSPGGSTLAGLRILEERAFRGAVMDCVIAAWQKNQNMG